MKLSCEVIRDLLPLYHDQVCSETSCQLVEEHLASCEACQQQLEQIHAEVKGGSRIEDTKPIREIAQTWKRDKKSAFLTGAMLVSFVACMICIISYQAIGSYVTPEGVLIEPFALIPLAYLFGLLGMLSGISLVIVRGIKRIRRGK